MKLCDKCGGYTELDDMIPCAKCGRVENSMGHFSDCGIKTPKCSCSAPAPPAPDSGPVAEKVIAAFKAPNREVCKSCPHPKERCSECYNHEPNGNEEYYLVVIQAYRDLASSKQAEVEELKEENAVYLNLLNEVLKREEYDWAYSSGAASKQAEVEGLVKAAQEVWSSVPGSYGPDDPMVMRHSRALNELHAALSNLGKG